MTYYWISFVDTDRPVSEQFLGGCLVEAENGAEAVREAWRKRCHPGGTAAVIEITAEYVAKFEVNRLYSKQDIIDMGEHRTLDQAVADGDVE